LKESVVGRRLIALGGTHIEDLTEVLLMDPRRGRTVIPARGEAAPPVLRDPAGEAHDLRALDEARLDGGDARGLRPSCHELLGLREAIELPVHHLDDPTLAVTLRREDEALPKALGRKFGLHPGDGGERPRRVPAHRLGRRGWTVLAVELREAHGAREVLAEAFEERHFSADVEAVVRRDLVTQRALWEEVGEQRREHEVAPGDGPAAVGLERERDDRAGLSLPVVLRDVEADPVRAIDDDGAHGLPVQPHLQAHGGSAKLESAGWSLAVHSARATRKRRTRS